MVFSFSLLTFVRAALPRTTSKHATQSQYNTKVKFQRTVSYCISKMDAPAQP